MQFLVAIYAVKEIIYMILYMISIALWNILHKIIAVEASPTICDFNNRKLLDVTMISFGLVFFLPFPHLLRHLFCIVTRYLSSNVKSFEPPMLNAIQGHIDLHLG